MSTRILTRAYRDIVDIWNYTANDKPTAADEQEERFLRQSNCWVSNRAWGINVRT